MSVTKSMLKKHCGSPGPGWRRLGLAAMLAVALPPACTAGEAQYAVPVASLGQTVAAQQQFKSLEQAWYEGSDRERPELEPRFVRFIQSFPNDPECHPVQVWLAWLRTEKGKLDEALALVDQASVEKVGSTFDAAQVVRAAVFTRRGQPESSLRILEPLSGKIVESRERDTWAREIIQAALKLKHDDDALKWALVWRLESSEDRRGPIDREISLVLDQVSRPALDRLWNQLVVADRIPTTSQARKQGRLWMREAVLQRLTRFAVDARDSNLARRLLNDAWLPLQKSSNLRRLTRVAAQGQVELQNLTRSIGIILELDDSEGRRRSSEFVTGVLQTLDEMAGPHPVRLHTREALMRDREGYAEAVEDLYNEGVAILIGGFEAPSALELAKKASAKRVSAIALTRLEPSEHGDFAYWIDATDRAIVERWVSSNSGTNGAGKVVTDADPECMSEQDSPMALWREARFERVMLDCSTLCAEKLGQSAADVARLPAIWLGPKAVNAADSWRVGQIKGYVNFERLLDAKERAPGLDQWEKRFSRLPSYYEVFGHDVALIAAAGLDAFPDVVAPDAASRDRVLRDVATRLARVETALWSTRSKGFGANHSIVPQFALQIGAPSERSPAIRHVGRP